MPPKAAEKTEDPKPEEKTEAPKAAEKTVERDPKVCALAEKIFIQMCMNARQGWTADHIAKQAHEYAKAFVNCTPSGE